MSGAKVETAWVSGLAARARAVAADSAWAGLLGKAALYATGFALLALVGSGRLSAWLSPPGRMAVGVAVAAAAPPPPASAVPAVAAVAGAAVDAGAAPPDAGGAPEGADAGAASPGLAPDGKVILNLAVEEDLRHLPGIGPTRARAILALRGRLKRFSRIEDLLKVKGLGRRSLARLRPLVRLD